MCALRAVRAQGGRERCSGASRFFPLQVPLLIHSWPFLVGWPCPADHSDGSFHGMFGWTLTEGRRRSHDSLPETSVSVCPGPGLALQRPDPPGSSVSPQCPLALLLEEGWLVTFPWSPSSALLWTFTSQALLHCNTHRGSVPLTEPG